MDGSAWQVLRDCASSHAVDALTAFHDCRWRLDYLRPVAGT
jgi:hypothetical protein